MTPPRLIVGLGNPGSEYDDNRHNLGFWFVDRLAADLKKVVEDPAFRKKAEEQGAAADYLGPQQLSERARADFANWAGVIKSSKIEAE